MAIIMFFVPELEMLNGVQLQRESTMSRQFVLHSESPLAFERSRHIFADLMLMASDSALPM